MYHDNLRPSIKSMKLYHWYFITNVDLNLKSKNQSISYLFYYLYFY